MSPKYRGVDEWRDLANVVANVGLAEQEKKVDVRSLDGMPVPRSIRRSDGAVQRAGTRETSSSAGSGREGKGRDDYSNWVGGGERASETLRDENEGAVSGL
ncbi:hypothetical protein AC579_1264 [Pseudocercospora musae]|uniref:Uncharacterized protein n=1 Tax=Pseudocercospora musae TaxID=113226 RepID=A0A139I7C0_9PEZI|nr:hypothetical protein AC579_1264 [Pseudocercospora musae]